jgi:anti-anti-sigma factor
MDITFETQGEALVASVCGRLDSASASDFEQQCSTKLEQGGKALIIDMHQVDYISSAGLRSILSLGKKLKADQGSLAFVGMQGIVKEVFDMSGFNNIFPVYSSLGQALERQ